MTRDELNAELAKADEQERKISQFVREAKQDLRLIHAHRKVLKNALAELPKEPKK
jgi:hypothetical protein